MIKLPQLLRWLLGIGFIFLVLFTSMRLGLYLFFNKQGHSFSQAGSAFWLGLRYDLRSISVILLPILILGSFKFLHPFKNRVAWLGWMILLSLATLFVLFFFMVDFAHYAYLVQRLNASVLNYLEDARISMDMVWQSYPVTRMLLVLLAGTVLIVWLIAYGHRRILRLGSMAGKRTRIVGFIVFFLVTGFLIFGKFSQYPLRWSDAFALGDDYRANLALNPFESFLNTLKFRNSTYDEKKVRELYPVLAEYYNLPREPPVPLQFARQVVPRDTVIPMRPNVVLVICESFSGYKSSMWGNPLHTTPFFDSLSKQGVFFDHCFTPTYGTARGVWATLTGIPDVEMPTTASRNPLAVDQHVIINNFTGYEKFYFLGGSTSWANIRGLLTNNIQDLHLYEQDDFKAPKIDVWGISDKNLFLESNKILAAQTKPFFAVIQTADNHRPYTIPEEDQQEFIKIDMPVDSLKKYGFETLAEMNAFRYTDFCYRKFMEAASKESYFKNTLFVFIGDHGIPGDVGNMFPRAWTEQRLTAEHVPLLFYCPALLPPQRLQTISSQADVLPTIAGMCKIPYVNTTLGKDLMDSLGSAGGGFAFIFDPDLRMAGLIKGDYFYRKMLHAKTEELVSIVNNEKPGNDSATARITADMRRLTEALHETAQYLLLNNKKGHYGAH
jgi:phosphoglycerol transferase MdoB-like AlkP superfamily enzyme